MRLIALLAVVGTAAAVQQLSRSVRNANWAALQAETQEDQLELVFANALWRHGDRSAEHAVPGGDPFTEDDWQLGGGGYGELTPLGMKMHFELGQKLYDRYINKTGTFPEFLDAAYNAKQIYIRSTDYNRTLVSAYANVQGMFGGRGIAGQNYPDDVEDWPLGYVPIPVHTVDKDTDFVGHPDSKCLRQKQLYDLVRKSPEYQNYQNDTQISQILKYFSDNTGGTEVDIDNIYDIQDPIIQEEQNIEFLNGTGATIDTFYPWFTTGDVRQWAEWIIDQDEDFTNGIGISPSGTEGIDMSIEIPKIRAGETLKTIVGNVHGAINCKTDIASDSCRPFYKNLRYYAISAHDTTLAAFLTILGVKKYTIPKGYPNYAAAILLEVYKKNATEEYSFKVIYHPNSPDLGEGKPITGFVRGCDFTSDYCPISVLDDLVATYTYDGDMAELCATPPNGVPVTTTPKPVTGASSTASVTTPTTPTTKPTTTSPVQPPTTSSVSSLSLLSALVVMLLPAFL